MIKVLIGVIERRKARRNRILEIDETQQPGDRDGRCCVSHFSSQPASFKWNDKTAILLAFSNELPPGQRLVQFRVGRHLHHHTKPMLTANAGIEVFEHDRIPESWSNNDSIFRIFFLGTLWRDSLVPNVAPDDQERGRYFLVYERGEDGRFAMNFAPAETELQEGDFFAVRLG